MSETIRPAVYPVDEDDCPSRLERAERDLAACRALLAELVAAEDELDRLGRYLRDPDVDEHEWDAAWARIEQRREHAIDAMRDWLAQHPAEGGQDATD